MKVAVNFISPFPLLTSTYDTLQRASLEDSKLRGKHSESGDAFWPSMASIVYPATSADGRMYEKVEGTCLRQAYYKMMRVPESDGTSVRSFRAITMGNAAEDIYKEWFHGVDGYRVIFPDIRGKKLRFSSVFDGIRLRGEVDIIMEHVETSTRFGVEMKTYDGLISAANLCGVPAAKEAYKSWIPLDFVDDRAPFPKVQNLLQTMLYLREFWNDGIHLWKIIYGARDRGPDAEFDISLADINGKHVAIVNSKAYPEFNLTDIFDRYNELKGYVERQEVPPRDYVPEYDTDFLMTNTIRPTFNPRNPRVRTAHELWRDQIDKKVARSKKKSKEQVVIDEMAKSKSDWQCNFCSFRSICVGETSDISPL